MRRSSQVCGTRFVLVLQITQSSLAAHATIDHKRLPRLPPVPRH
jgi:hypothetical protein